MIPIRRMEVYRVLGTEHTFVAPSPYMLAAEDTLDTGAGEALGQSRCLSVAALDPQSCPPLSPSLRQPFHPSHRLRHAVLSLSPQCQPISHIATPRCSRALTQPRQPTQTTQTDLRSSTVFPTTLLPLPRVRSLVRQRTIRAMNFLDSSRQSLVSGRKPVGASPFTVMVARERKRSIKQAAPAGLHLVVGDCSTAPVARLRPIDTPRVEVRHLQTTRHRTSPSRRERPKNPDRSARRPSTSDASIAAGVAHPPQVPLLRLLHLLLKSVALRVGVKIRATAQTNTGVCFCVA